MNGLGMRLNVLGRGLFKADGEVSECHLKGDSTWLVLWLATVSLWPGCSPIFSFDILTEVLIPL